MQKSTFSNGGFVLHKITLPGYAGRFSAWFDPTGNLSDCEQLITRAGIGFVTFSRPVKRDGPVWKQLADIGKRENDRHWGRVVA